MIILLILQVPLHTLIKITPVAYGCQVEIMMIKVKKILSMMKIKVKKVLKPGFSFNYFLFDKNNTQQLTILYNYYHSYY